MPAQGIQQMDQIKGTTEDIQIDLKEKLKDRYRDGVFVAVH